VRVVDCIFGGGLGVISTASANTNPSPAGRLSAD